MEFCCQINLLWNLYKVVYVTNTLQKKQQQKKHTYANLTTAFDLYQLSLQWMYPLQIS